MDTHLLLGIWRETVTNSKQIINKRSVSIFLQRLINIKWDLLLTDDSSTQSSDNMISNYHWDTICSRQVISPPHGNFYITRSSDTNSFRIISRFF